MMLSSSSEPTFSVSQGIISRSGQVSNLLVRTIHENFLTSAHLKDLLSTISPTRDGLSDALGVAPIFTSTQPQQLSMYAPRNLHRDEGRKLAALAFATSTVALVVFLDRTLKGCDASRVNLKGKKGKDKKRGRALLNNLLLSQDTPPITRKFAIDAEALTTSLHMSLELRISHLADALSLSQLRSRRHNVSTRVLAHLQSALPAQDVNADALRDILTDGGPVEQTKVDDNSVRKAALRAWLAHAIAVHASKCQSLNRVRVVDSTASSKEELDTLSRMFNEGQRLAALKVQKEIDGITSCFSVAESLRSTIVVRALNDPSALYGIPLFRAIFSADAGALINREDFWDDAPALPPPTLCANIPGISDIQADIIQRALNASNEERIMLVHGPPGTGKTSTIAAICTAAAAMRPIWVLSQSNAIAWAAAARLLSSGFQSFRLLVGKDSRHFDSLYPELEPYILTSDEGMTKIDVKRLTSDGVRVIVCTLARMADRQLRYLKEALPVQTVIMDEAGQIDINDLVPLIHAHSTTLARLVFFGDEKQLSPYQQDNVPSIRSIFEIVHLRKSRITMDVQYRMPHIIANFFSRRVYHGEFLRINCSVGSRHACRFVDVSPPRKVATTKKEDPESHHESLLSHEKGSVIMAARRYAREGLDFKIIAGMEGHRVALAQRLEEAGLSPSLCVTINDFHGSEADHIIVYLGRGWKVDARDERRAAVMLSRCRVSMLICTSKRYLESDDAKETLPALLAKDCGPRSWVTWNEYTEERWPLVRA